MKRLILMRHAKSDWSLNQEDHDRPLNKRGRKSAAALGNWLRARGSIPDQILCSSSIRTRETLALLDVAAETRFERDLYHAAPQTMMDSLNCATGDTVLMIGHNPGIALFARGLLGMAPDHPRFRDYPTCATLVARFDIAQWAELDSGMGTAEAFVVPRELLEQA